MKKVLPLVLFVTALAFTGCNFAVKLPENELPENGSQGTDTNDPVINNGLSNRELTAEEKEEIFEELLTDEKKAEIFLSLLSEEKKVEIFNEILKTKHDDATFLSLLTEEEKNVLKLEYEVNLSDAKKQEIISEYLTNERKAEIFDEILGTKRSSNSFLSILTEEEKQTIYRNLLTDEEKAKIIADYLTEEKKTEIFNKIVEENNYVALLTAEEKSAMEEAAVAAAKDKIISDYLDANRQSIFNTIAQEKHNDNTFVNLLTDAEKANLKALFESEGVNESTANKIISDYLTNDTKTAIAAEVLKNTSASFTAYLNSAETQTLLKNNLSEETKKAIFAELLTQAEKDRIITEYLTDEKKAEIYEEKLAGTKEGIEQKAIEAYVVSENKEAIFAKLMTEDDKKAIFNEMLTQEEKNKIINALSAETLQNLLDGKDVVAPENVTNLKAANTDKSALLSWSPSEAEDLLCYEITYKTETAAVPSRAVSFEPDSIIVPAGTNSALVSNLTNGKTYTFTVKAMDKTGNKNSGSTVSCEIKEIYKSISMTTALSTTDLVIQGLTVTVDAKSDSEIKKITWKEFNSSVSDVTTDTLLKGTDITETKSFFVTENGVYVVACESADGFRTSHYVNITNSVITTSRNTTVFDGKNNKFFTKRNGYSRNNPTPVKGRTFLLNSANIVIKDLTLEGDKGSTHNEMNYNVFEMGIGDNVTPIESITVENLKTTGNIEHSTLAAYTFADNAVMTVKNSSFTRNDDDPFIRLANMTHAKNVTIKLENVDLKYVNGAENYPGWNGFIIYQTANGSDRTAVAEEIEATKTWHFIFENCTYNGKLITTNEPGNSALIYSYDINFDDVSVRGKAKYELPGCDIVINGKKLYAPSEAADIVTTSGNTATVKDAVLKTPRKGTDNAAVLLNAENIVIDNVEVTGAEAKPAYNIFEQPCSTVSDKIKTVNVSNLTFDGTNITHNFLNFYNFADNAAITVKDSSFDIKADNNIMRLSNLSNAKNVTVTFENIDWKYDETVTGAEEWASIILYQSCNTNSKNKTEEENNAIIAAEIEALNTWNFNFVNCRYNGQVVSEETATGFKKFIVLYVQPSASERHTIKTKISDWKLTVSESDAYNAAQETEDTATVSNISVAVPRIGEKINPGILLNKSNVVIENVKVTGSATTPAYNIFEQPCSTDSDKIKTVNVSNLDVDGSNITHNFLNFYNFEDNATVTVKDSKFDIKSDNNILRLSNLSYAKNVTITFENIDWKYDETADSFSDGNEWASVIMYQYTKKNITDLKNEIAALNTWNFKFVNCRYNGEPVTENPETLYSFKKLLIVYGLDVSGAKLFTKVSDWKLTMPEAYTSYAVSKTEDTTTISNVSVSVPKTDSNAGIKVDTSNVVIDNVKVTGSATTPAYNIFEQPCSTSSEKIKSVEVSNLTVDGSNIKNNFLNFYNLEDNATITVKDSKFDIKSSNNILRLSNLSYAKNVTVTFKNIDWKYDETADAFKNNNTYASIILYQSTEKKVEDAEVKSELLKKEAEALKTWNFNFVNCRYNGQEVTAEEATGFKKFLLLYVKPSDLGSYITTTNVSDWN